ncbi:MAG: SMC-Scp complex subunit ScpB [Candidatus Bathyarchaeia archaeon]
MSRESGMTKRLAVLEAALYTAGRPVEMGRLKRLVRTRSDRVVQKLVRALAERYDARGSALEIKELPGNRVVLRLRGKFAKMARRFARRPLLTIGPLKTLSYIAYYQPVEQSKVIEERGSHVYNHLRMMEQLGLIARERISSREVIIRTTPYFADYFGFSHDPIKSRLQLQWIFNRMKITKLDNGGDIKPGELMAAPPAPRDMLVDEGYGLTERLMDLSSTAQKGS